MCYRIQSSENWFQVATSNSTADARPLEHVCCVVDIVSVYTRNGVNVNCHIVTKNLLCIFLVVMYFKVSSFFVSSAL
jgi:hypothetical protein